MRMDGKLTNPVSVFGDGVVLELKFTGRFPNWMADLVRVFGLKQCSAAKYVDGIVRLGEAPRSSEEILRRMRSQSQAAHPGVYA